jgi:hypothetical protein
MGFIIIVNNNRNNDIYLYMNNHIVDYIFLL